MRYRSYRYSAGKLYLDYPLTLDSTGTAKIFKNPQFESVRNVRHFADGIYVMVGMINYMLIPESHPLFTYYELMNPTVMFGFTVEGKIASKLIINKAKAKIEAQVREYIGYIIEQGLKSDYYETRY